MREIKVFLQYPWIFPDSPYYRYLINYPPTDIRYINLPSKFKIHTSKHKIKLMNFIKNKIRRTLEILKIPNLVYTISNPEIIHCAHCLSLNKKPWVVDIEHYWSFSASSKIAYSHFGKKIIKKKLTEKWCKKILPWSYAAKESIKNALPNRDIRDKLEVVYPAVPYFDIKKKRGEKEILLFIGRYFHQKGGLISLKVIDEITKKYDRVESIFISEVPEKIRKKYTKKNKKIHFIGLIKQEKLFKEIYPYSHILVYPGFSDTFGFAMLEAMSFGLPIITANGFARREIVEDGKTGFVIEHPGKINYYKIGEKEEKIAKEMIEKTSILIEDSALRNRMGREARKIVKEGKFSIKKRNKKLREIYEEAL